MQRPRLVLTALAGAAFVTLPLLTEPAAMAQAPATIDFELAALGAAGACTPGLTAGGGPVDWRIVEDVDAPAGGHVLAQLSSDRTGNRFPVCVFAAPEAADVAITVAFRAVSGTVDQAAGVMVRVIDENNYYVARANALEDNVRLYKVVDGVRTQLAGANTPVVPGIWQTLGIRIEGNMIEVLFNGDPLFATQDETFASSGRTGVWTKADSVTYFDKVEITVLR
jgi:hypothetical protein